MCEHENSKVKKIKREFKDQFFETTLPVCLDCGAELWTSEKTKEFEKWVATQKKPRIQFNKSSLSNQCLEKLCGEVSATKLRTVVKALILVFVNISKNGGLKNLNDVYETEQFKAFEDADNDTNFGFEVAPQFYLDIESLANVYDLKPNELAWEALHLMLAIFFSQDKDLKKYWDEVIFPKLQEYLKVS